MVVEETVDVAGSRCVDCELDWSAWDVDRISLESWEVEGWIASVRLDQLLVESNLSLIRSLPSRHPRNVLYYPPGFYASHRDR